mmetsp:Transcript_16535/g.42246  ORF Transcript_16535/g.42246 Transcript_16535/m.42246 type:complete len:241 (+) Transcript_16535:1526-2248(+)
MLLWKQRSWRGNRNSFAKRRRERRGLLPLPLPPPLERKRKLAKMRKATTSTTKANATMEARLVRSAQPDARFPQAQRQRQGFTYKRRRCLPCPFSSRACTSHHAAGVRMDSATDIASSLCLDVYVLTGTKLGKNACADTRLRCPINGASTKDAWICSWTTTVSCKTRHTSASRSSARAHGPRRKSASSWTAFGRTQKISAKLRKAYLVARRETAWNFTTATRSARSLRKFVAGSSLASAE